MSRPRTRLKSVISVLLLWQLTATTLLVGPAIAAAQTIIPPGAAATHCQLHGQAAVTTEHAPGLGDSAPSDSADDPNCCQGMNSCDCLCAQGSAAIPQRLTAMPVVTDRPDHADLRSPPLLQRAHEVFRPPI